MLTVIILSYYELCRWLLFGNSALLASLHNVLVCELDTLATLKQILIKMKYKYCLIFRSAPCLPKFMLSLIGAFVFHTDSYVLHVREYMIKYS